MLAGIPDADTVGWVRSHYHPWAVESPELQGSLIARLDQWSRTSPMGAE
jgi:hypothetical protein